MENMIYDYECPSCGREITEEEWDAVHDFFREEYRKKHPIRWWIEEIRFKFDMLTARFRKNDDIPF